MDNYAVKVVKGNETVGQLPHKFSRIAWPFLHELKKSVWKWSVTDEIVSACVEKWRFHATWSLAFQTKCKWNAWKNYSGFRTWRCKQTALQEPPLKVQIVINKRFSVNLWPLQAGLLLLKAMVSRISRTHDYWLKILAKRCNLHMSLYGNLFSPNIEPLNWRCGLFIGAA